ncbi:hypothetical protein [Methylobacterium sp. P5_C11]
MRANALAFIDYHGAEAHRLGWTAPQFFGVHPEHGFLRVEHAGALMVNDRPVVTVESDQIVFDRFSGCVRQFLRIAGSTARPMS